MPESVAAIRAFTACSGRSDVPPDRFPASHLLSSSYAGLVFDLDGTVLDTMSHHCERVCSRGLQPQRHTDLCLAPAAGRLPAPPAEHPPARTPRCDAPAGQAWDATAKKYGLQLKPERLLSLAGMPTRAIMELLCEEQGLADIDMDVRAGCGHSSCVCGCCAGRGAGDRRTWTPM